MLERAWTAFSLSATSPVTPLPAGYGYAGAQSLSSDHHEGPCHVEPLSARILECLAQALGADMSLHISLPCAVVSSRLQSRCFNYARESRDQADMAKVLTFDEARRIALNNVKLPELLGANS